MKLYKLAKEFEEKSKKSEELLMFVAFLRALSILHQHHHWEFKAYEDHLLFERIYNEIQDDLDNAAEKIIGVYGENIDAIKTTSAALKIIEKIKQEKANSYDELIAAEKMFVDFSKKLYDQLKEKDQLTLGVDDMIMSISSNHEKHIYLLTNSNKSK